jgi:hypothetical protein
MTKTNAGNDFQYGVMAASASNGTGAYAPANYIALSATATGTTGAETTLAGEIVTAGGGLLRAQATSITHTAGTNTYALSKTFTTNGSDALPVTIASIGIFNAASAGTLVFRTVLGTTATLSAVGDQLTITDTVTM